MIELCGRPCVYCLYCVCCLYCAAGTYPDSGPAHWLAQITLQKPRYIQTGLPEPWQTSSACSSSWWWWSSRVHAYLVSDGDILMVVVAAVVGLHYLPSAFVIKGIWAELVTPHRADHIACWWWWRVSAYTPSALPQGWVVFCWFFCWFFFFFWVSVGPKTCCYVTVMCFDESHKRSRSCKQKPRGLVFLGANNNPVSGSFKIRTLKLRAKVDKMNSVMQNKQNKWLPILVPTLAKQTKWEKIFFLFFLFQT